ncbi:lipase family protein [Tsukamurella soli]|uniref:Lipase family protein n=1 Tax=Tsukamurella soli TaxID=644556 RepID=A0ABP8KJG8_9ACTN
MTEAAPAAGGGDFDAVHDHSVVCTAHPLPPEEDPFHRPPPGFEQLPPGTVLRSRRVQVGVFGRIGLKNRAWQVQYRTADHLGAPRTSVATLIEPRGPRRVPRPLLSYQCAIDAIAPRCFPSYALRRGARSYGAATRWELLNIGMALARGWAAVVPDHEGVSGNWGAPRESGYCTLDAIRAARSFEPFDVADDDPTVMWGYSGGGLATAWAAELHPEYAPELAIAGAVLGSPVGSLRNTFLRLAGGPFGGLALTVVAGLYRAYPEFHAFLDAHVTPRGRELLAQADSLSTVEALARFRNFDPADLLDMPLADFMAGAPVRDMFADIEPGTRAPSCPVLVLQGVPDPVISIADVDGLVEAYRDRGARIEYWRDRGAEHIALAVVSVTPSLDWLAARCVDARATARTRTSVLALRPGVWLGLIRHGLVVARFAVGAGVGPRGW